MIFCIVHIQIVNDKNALRSQTRCNGPHGIVVFTPGGKISETGKKIKRIIEIVYPKRQADIMLVEMQIALFLQRILPGKLVGILNAFK